MLEPPALPWYGFGEGETDLGGTMFGFLKRKKAARQAAKAAEVEAAQVAEVDPNSPLGHNQRLFDRLNHDIESGSLPEVDTPSRGKVAACEERRREALERAQAAYDAEEVHEPWGAIYTLERVRANQEIPVDVELWVEAICEHYLHDAMPMMGLVHWEDGVRKRLFEMRGHKWYTTSEIYPMVHFD